MKSKTPTIRTINKDDIESFNNGSRYRQSLRGLTVELNGEPIGIAGVLHTNPLQVFSEMRDEMRDYPILIMKTAKRLLNIMETYDKPLYALASENENDPDSFLIHLGFEFTGENEQGRYYKWQKLQKCGDQYKAV